MTDYEFISMAKHRHAEIMYEQFETRLRMGDHLKASGSLHDSIELMMSYMIYKYC